MSRRRYMCEKKNPNTLLLCHFENYTDSSKYARVLTSSATSIIGGGKFGSCLQVNAGRVVVDLSVVKDNTSVFTIDCFAYLTDTEINIFYAYPIAYGVLGLTMSANKASIVRNGDAFFINISGLRFTRGWHHVAVVVNGIYIYLFIDGMLVDSYTGSMTTTSAPQLNIGHGSPAGTLIDEFRVSSVARWTGNFTPPTSPYQPD